MKGGVFILFVIFFLPGNSFSQAKPIQPAPKSIPLPMPATILNGDTVEVCWLNTVNVVSARKFENFEDAKKYYWLVYNVKTVYPYAILAEANFKQLENAIQTMPSGSEKRKYLKQMEKQLSEEYKKDLEILSPEQGGILIKLIDRETGVTPYEMIKDLKGSLTAFMWQTIGKLYGNNLKDTYSPEDDEDIDNIVQSIESGAI